MSKFLTQSAIQQFDAEVKHDYQRSSILRPTITNRNNVTGDQYKFARMGKGLADQKSTAADVVPMDVDHSRIPAILENWYASEYTDIFDQATVNFDERSELAKTVAMALGRRSDQLIIDAVDAESSPAADIADGGTGLTIDKLREAKEALDDKGVPGTDRFIVISPAGLRQLLETAEVTSSDFNTIRALVAGELNSFLGFTFNHIETRSEGGLPVTGTVRTAYAYHKMSVGCATGIDQQTRIDWVPQKTSWLTVGILKQGCVSRDGDGIVKIAYDEAV
jgi:Tfp pilus assembly protein PilV